MTRVHLGRIWTFLGVFVAIYALNAWLVSTGSGPLFSMPVLDGRRVISEYFAIPIVGVSLALLAAVGCRYAAKSRHGAWTERIPVVGLTRLNPAAIETKAYQLFFVVLFVILPVCSLVHFNRKIWNEGHVAERRPLAPGAHVTDLGLWVKGTPFGNDFCFGRRVTEPISPAFGGAIDPCKRMDAAGLAPAREGGITWLPMVSPLLVVIVTTAVAWLMCLVWLGTVFQFIPSRRQAGQT